MGACISAKRSDLSNRVTPSGESNGPDSLTASGGLKKLGNNHLYIRMQYIMVGYTDILNQLYFNRCKWYFDEQETVCARTHSWKH